MLIKPISYQVNIDPSVQRGVISAVSDIATEICMYVIRQPQGPNFGRTMRIHMHRTFTGSGIKYYNPWFVPETSENRSIISQKYDSFELTVIQRNNKVFVTLDFLKDARAPQSFDFRYIVVEEERK